MIGMGAGLTSGHCEQALSIDIEEFLYCKNDIYTFSISLNSKNFNIYKLLNPSVCSRRQRKKRFFV